MLSRLPKSTLVLLAFATVYLLWGSTYVAIHVAAEQLPVPVVSASRATIAAIFIALICLFFGRSLKVPRDEIWKLALVGVLFMSVNNMLLTWGETMLASGFASLIISTVPIMIALLNAALPGGEPMNKRGWSGTLLGTAGIFVLIWPSLHHYVPQPGMSHPLLGVLVLLGAALSFSVGSVLSQRFHFRADTLVATGWELGAAALFNWIFALATGVIPHSRWTSHGMEAILYLSIFGSIFGLVAFTYLLQNVAVTKVATYAFVNPLIAVLLGVLLLHERLVSTELAGMAVILCAVAMVIYSRVNRVSSTLTSGVGDPTE